LEVLSGKEQGAKRDIVILNAAAAIVVGRKAKDLTDGLKFAAESVDSGAAMKKLELLRKFTNDN
jgi:anthranilate phosphoribosyltransferase